MIRIAGIDVTAIVDEDVFEIDITRLLPDAEPGRLARHHWLAPDHADLDRGVVKLGMQSFLVRTGGMNILVDACIGQHKERPAHAAWHRRQSGRFLDELAASGLHPEEIDLVMCTHLHADHVGWNTRLENGQWVPTFPRALYAMSGLEFAYWQDRQAGTDAPVNHGAFDDSILPVVRSGQASFVAPGDEFAEGMRIVSLAGHTIDHLGLELSVGGKACALFCGDAIHSPIQVVMPQWASAFCSDPAAAVATRIDLLQRAADEHLLLIPAHLRGRRAMRITRTEGGFEPRFDF
jgi:glyoxylase-like metal-dependent hydrolase (beta-lactamase superfamily II)